jgi:hypothetical protein
MMKRVSGLAFTLIALCAAGSPARGQFFRAAPSPNVQIQQTQIRLQEALSKQRLAADQLERTKKQYDAGTVSQAELSSAQLLVAQTGSEVAQVENELKGLTEEKHKSDRIATLRRPVTVELRDAPVRQAAQVLSQASSVPIDIDKGVPTDKRLTVVAQAVPLATVLDTVARQTGLEIAPEGDGVLLKSSPTLEVNGQRTEVMSPFAPWSSEWETNPAANLMEMGGYRRVNYPLSGGGVGHTVVPAATPVPHAPPPEPGGGTPALGQVYQSAPAPGFELPSGAAGGLVPAPQFGGGLGNDALPGSGDRGNGFSGGFGMSVGGTLPVTMTALSSNTFVVASPAPGGESGVMLTVYRLEGTELRKVSSTLHRLGPAGTARPGARYAPSNAVPYGYSGGARGQSNRNPLVPRIETPQPDTTPGPLPGAPQGATPSFDAPGLRFAPAPDAVPRRPGDTRPLLGPDAPQVEPPGTAPAPGAPDLKGLLQPLPEPTGNQPGLRGPDPSRRRGTDQVMVLGAVARPGEYQAGENMRALDALASAGGMTQQADPAQVRVWRNGKSQTLDLRRLHGNVGSDLNPPLSPGDRLVVPVHPGSETPASSSPVPAASPKPGQR